MTNSVKIVLIIAISIVIIVGMGLVYASQIAKNISTNNNLEQKIENIEKQLQKISEKQKIDNTIEENNINQEDLTTQILKQINSKFNTQNSEIKNNVIFEYRLTSNNTKTISGKSIKLNDIVISKSPEDMLEKTINSIGLKTNISNSADGAGTSIMGYNNSELACLVIETDLKKLSKTSVSADLEIQCGELK